MGSSLPIIGVATLALGAWPAIFWCFVWESHYGDYAGDTDYQRFTRRMAIGISALCGGLYILFFLTFPFG